jgi:hypothetical protein
MEANRDDSATATSWRVLRLSTRPIGSLMIRGHSLDAESINATVSLTAVAIERARSFAAESRAAERAITLRGTGWSRSCLQDASDYDPKFNLWTVGDGHLIRH